jgi:hypothetical protein
MGDSLTPDEGERYERYGRAPAPGANIIFPPPDLSRMQFAGSPASVVAKARDLLLATGHTLACLCDLSEVRNNARDAPARKQANGPSVAEPPATPDPDKPPAQLPEMGLVLPPR